MNYRIEDPYNEKGHLKKWIYADCCVPALTVVAMEHLPPTQIAKENERIKIIPLPLHIYKPTGHRSPWDFIEHKPMPEGKFFYEYQYDHTDGVDVVLARGNGENHGM